MRTAGWVTAAVLVALGAYAGLDAADRAPGPLTTEGAVAAPRPRLAVLSGADLPLSPPPTSAASPAATQLAASLGALAADPALGPSVGIVVRDGHTGQVLYGKDPATARTPASATKLLTAAAIVTSMPMSATLDTVAVRGPAGQVTLVAGGDTLVAPGAGNAAQVLGRAGLGDLADQVAAQLRRTPAGTPSGTPGSAVGTPVQIVLDEGGLAGPRINPDWLPADVQDGYAGPVAPLGLVASRPAPGTVVPEDPALTAAEAFRDLLAARGVAVDPTVTRGSAPRDGQRIGIIHSAPVGDQLAFALAESDNTLTSALARVAAVRAGTAPTFPAVATWVSGRLTALGVPTTGLVVADASGLAPGSKASAETLAAVLMLAAGDSGKDLARAYAGLPIAGLTGTLATRYATDPQRSGAGLVRAKTGTLTGVSSLAGSVVDADGRLLVFAMLADRVPADGTEEARAALDRIAATLATCGCR